ncbi:hypothetical protein GH714_009970 [Hevea brasiliensis]|uniref:Uncharacterized protein n=1 Tax=Hevea brasiliensis TaxID=3981 RepID=A0A6A6KCB4_HEVBR|nr:hypothetical protein GH714_009970 [Hevea brasiliensis]
MVSAHQSHVAFDKKRSMEIEKREDASVLIIKTIKLTDNYKGVDQYSILRQKALENLRRFHGGFQTNAKNDVNQKDMNDGTLKSPSTTKAEVTETESLKDDGALVVGRNSANSMQKDEKIVDGKCSSTQPRGCSRQGKGQYDFWLCDKVNNTSDVSSAELSSCFAPTGEDVGLNKLQDEGKEGLQLEKKVVSSVTTMKGSGHCDAVNNASCSTSAEPSSHLASEARDISSIVQ